MINTKLTLPSEQRDALTDTQYDEMMFALRD